MIKGIKHSLVNSNRYIVRFAQNEADIKAAQQLRFNVFNLELGEGLKSSYENRADADIFDQQCHHLLVIEKQSSKVIGTYRMQTYTMAHQQQGFYTAAEFDLSSIPDEVMQQSVEVGRACIAKEHRNGRVLFLLWRGLAQYLIQMNAHYLFGCCSVTSQDPKIGWQVMKYLEMNQHLHSTIRINTMPPFICPTQDINEKKAADIELPQLFRLYIDLGAKVCSPPALDREFKTIDYLILLDIKKLDERTKMLFFK